MNIISDILFIISNGLLIPVVLMLLFLLIKAILTAIGFYNEYMTQRRLMASLQQLVENYGQERLEETQSEWNGMDSSPVVKCF